MQEESKKDEKEKEKWINSKPTTLSEHKGKVILLVFWTFG
jgi:hypothetical protein